MNLVSISGRTRNVILVAGALACAAAGIAVGAESDDTTQQRMAQNPPVQAPKEVPAPARDTFAVLRSDERAVPDGVVDTLAKSPQYDRAFAPNAELAQPLPFENPYTGTVPWLVPADGGLCLYVPDTEGAGVTCATLAEARAGKLHLVLSPMGKPSFAVGVVPDGVTSVRGVDAHGSPRAIGVRDNTYVVTTDDVKAVMIGETRVVIPQAPKELPPLPAE